MKVVIGWPALFLLSLSWAELQEPTGAKLEDKESLLTPRTFDNWIASLGVRELGLVYLKTDDDGKNPLVEFSLNAIRDAESVLNLHGIYFRQLDCTANADYEKCRKPKKEPSLSCYTNGIWNDLPLNALFDEASVLSNTLELLLLKDVSVVQTEDQLVKMMNEAKSSDSNLMLMAFSATGSQEHANFMEVASFSVKNSSANVKFAYSTQPDAMRSSATFENQVLVKDLGIENRDVDLYLMKCKGMTADSITRSPMRCSVYRYAGALDKTAITTAYHIMAFESEKEKYYPLNEPSVTCFYDTDEEWISLRDGIFEPLQLEMMGIFPFFHSIRHEKKIKDWFSAEISEYVSREQGSGPGCLVLYPYSESDSKAYVEPDVLREYLVDVLLKPVLTGEAAHREERNSKLEYDDNVELSEIDLLIEAVESQDDDVVLREDDFGGRAGLDLSHVQKLTRDTFDPKEFDGIVLFHLQRYDARCRLILRLYDAVAAEANQTLSIIDCYDWTDVCKKVKVFSYPAVRVYKSGQYLNYSGEWSETALTRLMQLSAYDAPHSVDGMIDLFKLRKFFKTAGLPVMIGLFDDTKSRVYKSYQAVAKKLYGQLAFTYATGTFAEKIQKQYSLKDLPVIVSYNPSQEKDNYGIRELDKAVYTAKSIEKFALSSTLPTLFELTAESLPAVYNMKLPFVILILEEKSVAILDKIQTLTTDKSLKNKFIFSYLMLKDDRNRRIVAKLSNESLTSVPTLLVVNYSQGKVYKQTAGDLGKLSGGDLGKLSGADIKEWLQAISIGNVNPTHTLPANKWEPVHPGYDFLEFIDKETAQLASHGRLHLPINVTTIADNSKSSGQAAHMEDSDGVFQSSSTSTPSNNGSSELPEQSSQETYDHEHTEL